jgi:hypothetical protein
MAKDAKGHGSNSRNGGGSGKVDWSNRASVNTRNDRMHAMFERARNDPNHPLGALTNAVSGAVARGAATPIAGIDKQAAAKLAEGGAPGKNTPAPIHTSFHDFEHGYNVKPSKPAPTGDDATDWERPA